MSERRLELYLTHRAALVDYATPIIGERGRAEDVVQDAFLRFVSHTPVNRPGRIERPTAYLYRIVRNLAFDVVRRHRTEERMDASAQWWMLPEQARTPEQDLIHRDALARVEAVLATMPVQRRRAVEMKRFGGHSLAEIATHLQVSIATAHRLVRDGLIEIAGAMHDDA